VNFLKVAPLGPTLYRLLEKADPGTYITYLGRLHTFYKMWEGQVEGDT
jgi:hypothetical protein